MTSLLHHLVGTLLPLWGPALGLLFLLTPVVTGAEKNPDRPKAPAKGKDKAPPKSRATKEQILERWKKMTPKDRARLLERYRKWKNLPAAEREQIRKRFEQLKKKPGRPVRPGIHEPGKPSPKDRTKLAANLRHWTSLTEEKRRRLLEKHKAFKKLPKERLAAIMKLDPKKRLKTLGTLYEDHRLNSLVRHFSQEEKKRVKKLSGESRRGEIQKILRERRAQQLKRIPDKTLKAIRRLPKARQHREIKNEFNRMFLKDQMLQSLLSSAHRKEFAGLPISRRDQWMLKKVRENSDKLKQRLPPQVYQALGKVDERERAFKLAEYIYAKKIEGLNRSLLPRQQADIAKLEPRKRLERATHLSRQNARRLLHALPADRRAEVQRLPSRERRKILEQHFLSRIPRDLWSSLSPWERRLYFRLPLIQKLDVVERLQRRQKAKKKTAGRGKKGMRGQRSKDD